MELADTLDLGSSAARRAGSSPVISTKLVYTVGGDNMPSKFQFDSVCELLASGVNNYVQIRQQVGLTSDELDDILNNMQYYKNYFAAQEQREKIDKLHQGKKKPWWKKI